MTSNWYIAVNGQPVGPLTEAQVQAEWKAGKVDADTWLWKPGFEGWKHFSQIPEFQSIKAAVPPPPVPQKPKDQRASARGPLSARLFLSNNKQVIAGVCRDISVGGMQVLTDSVPVKVGEVLKLNVTPAETNDPLTAFVAEGKVVRLLEDGTGFSFQFERLSESAKLALEKYLAQRLSRT